MNYKHLLNDICEENEHTMPERIMSSCRKLLRSSFVRELQITIRKWRLTGHAVGKGDESILEQALDWNTEGAGGEEDRSRLG